MRAIAPAKPALGVENPRDVVARAQVAVALSARLCEENARLRAERREWRARFLPLPQPAPRRTGAVPAARPARVVVVEHNPDDERLTRRALDAYAASLSVDVHRSGVAARDALAALDPPPDLVLCDLYLLDLAGDELARWARAQPRLAGVPFVVLTGSVRPSDGPRCLAAGASEHRVKPMELSDYVRTVHGVLARWLPRG